MNFKRSLHNTQLGAIQIIRDTLGVGEGLYGIVSPNDTRGREGVIQSFTWHFSNKSLNFILFTLTIFIFYCILFGLLFGRKRLLFWKIKMSRHRGAGVRFRASVSKWHIGVGLEGSNIGQKIVTYYLDGPLTKNTGQGESNRAHSSP